MMFFKVAKNPHETLDGLTDNKEFHKFWASVFACKNYVIDAGDDWIIIDVKNITQYCYSKWCLEHCKGKWSTAKTISGSYYLCFKDKSDALLFKLMMVGNG